MLADISVRRYLKVWSHRLQSSLHRLLRSKIMTHQWRLCIHNMYSTIWFVYVIQFHCLAQWYPWHQACRCILQAIIGRIERTRYSGGRVGLVRAGWLAGWSYFLVDDVKLVDTCIHETEKVKDGYVFGTSDSLMCTMWSTDTRNPWTSNLDTNESGRDRFWDLQHILHYI